MLYDTGGRGPRPMPPQQPAYQQPPQQLMRPPKPPQVPQPLQLPGVNGGPPTQLMYGMSSPPPSNQPMYGAPQQQPFGMRPRRRFRYGSAGGMMQGGMSGAYGGPPAAYDRDPNGNFEGEWDYRPQPQYQSTPMYAR